jgi:hypothetical protein
MAEGMQVTEQLKIQFDKGSAVALFGEMIDRGDGTYVYKDSTKLTPGFQMSQVDCTELDEQLVIEKYVRDNIKTIAIDKTVLGGTWYTTSVAVNATTNTGSVKYEDGHIQSNATFGYSYDAISQSVVIKDFLVK